MSLGTRVMVSLGNGELGYMGNVEPEYEGNGEPEYEGTCGSARLKSNIIWSRYHILRAIVQN